MSTVGQTASADKAIRANGAEIVSEPADMPYGERRYAARDFSGRLWAFSQSVADVAPEDWGGTSEPS